MKSKQLNFFITPKDYAVIDSFLKKNDVLVKINGFDYVNLQDISDEMHQLYLTRQNFEETIVNRVTEKGIKYYYIVSSYILEFSIGGFYSYNSNILNSGRFYYIKAYYVDNKILNKSEPFIEWCDNIINLFKKEFLKKYSKDKNNLYSESAIDWIESTNAKQINGGNQWVSQSDIV